MVLIVAIAATLIANQSQAQTDFHMLRGLSQVHILIEPLDDQAKACGLTSASIREAIMYPLSSSKIRVVSSLTDLVFYVGITSIYAKASQICFSNALVEARAYQDVMLDFSGAKAKRAEVNLWRQNEIYASYASNHAALVTSAIEKYTKKFITDWNLDNKPSTAKN
jgi:hypothetical protein